jgi:alginate O-acetyltransferase complex protein AlgI
MLFNSFTFILLFLPATLLGYWLLSRGSRPGSPLTWLFGALTALLVALIGADAGNPAEVGRRLAVAFPCIQAGLLLLPRLLGSARAGIAWLVLMSLVFYAYWSVPDLALILVLTFFNYGLGVWQNRWWERNGCGHKPALIFGIVADLAILGYFKYTDLALITTNALAGTSIPLQHIVLPLGISFYTFQKIAFIADAYQGKTREFDFLDYCLFVTFFPQLIAGPIVHHHDVIHQFKAMTGRLKTHDLAVGATIFVFGLFKKVVIADNLATPANHVFAAVAGDNPATLTFAEAWMGSLAYSGQLYFDFSGYSDMAIGLARLFSIRLPMNFYSPYQAGDIIEFWRRWHMTLSRFLRDYLYIPLGGNRKGETRRYVNLFLTFLIGGLWHGANWTFIAWGALHGLYTCICHAWKGVRERLGWTSPGRLARVLGVATTFLAVLVSWVFFRADSFAGAFAVLKAMAGFNGVVVNVSTAHWLRNLLKPLGVEFTATASQHFRSSEVVVVLGAMVVAFAMPNTMRILRNAEPALDHKHIEGSWLAWSMRRRWALLTAVLALVSLMSMTRISHFLYFQF